MSVDLYRVKYNFVYGSLTQEQVNFIDSIIYRSDDGTYELSDGNFQELKRKKSKYEKLYKADLAELFRKFGDEIEKGKGHFSFRVF
jgi:hypothetical protein